MSKRKYNRKEQEEDNEREREQIDEAYLDFIDSQQDIPLFVSSGQDLDNLTEIQNIDELGNTQTEEIEQSSILDEIEEIDALWNRKTYIEYLNEHGFDRLRYLLALSYDTEIGMERAEQEIVEKAIQRDDEIELGYLQTLNSIKYDDYQEFPPQIDMNEVRNQRRQAKIERQREKQIEREQQALEYERQKKDAIEQKAIQNEIIMQIEQKKLKAAQKQFIKLSKDEKMQDVMPEDWKPPDKYYKIPKKQPDVIIIEDDENIGDELYTYGTRRSNQTFKDTFNDEKNLMPRLSRMTKYSIHEKARIPDVNNKPPHIGVQYDNDLIILCKHIKELDIKFVQEYKQVNEINDGALIKVYIKQIATQLFRSAFVREYLFRDNFNLNNIITNSIIDPLVELQDDVEIDEDDFNQEKDRFANQLRFLILGAPLYNSLQEDNEVIAGQVDLFREQLDFVQIIENDEQNNNLMYLNYFLDGYMRSDEFLKFNKIKSQEMRQMFLLSSNRKPKNKRPRVGLFQTNENNEPLDLEYSLKTDITDEFISRYLPFAKLVNISDLLHLNGVKMTVYYKVIRLFHSMYMLLRDSAPFTNIFNFYQKVPALDTVKIVTNQNPIILISIMLATVKEYLSIRLREDLNFPETFMRELLFVVLPQQSTVTCQSIGCLYNYTISDVRLEPVVMIANLLIKVFSDNKNIIYDFQTFKLGWSFLKGAYQYITNFKYINTIIPEEWTEFYKTLFDSFSEFHGLLSATQISQIYQRIMENYLIDIQQARIERLAKKKENHNQERLISLKNWIIRVENETIIFDVSSLYFEKVFNFLQTKYQNYHEFHAGIEWNMYQAAYLIAGLILDTFVLKIQESLNDTVSLQSEATKLVIDQGGESVSSASLQYFSIIQRKERKKRDEIEYVEFRSMNIMPLMLWIKHCHISYKPYDIVARDYHISCIVMLVWFSSTKQYNLGLGDNEQDRLQIYKSYQIWQDKNYETIEQCDNIFVNSTKLMTTLKKYLRQDNLRVIQIANTQYALNVNQQKDEYLMLSKNISSQQQFIVGIYYNHVFMINHFVPIKKYNEKGYIKPCLISRMDTKSTYKPLINAIVFDIETTQIELDKDLEKQSHNMVPYMISSIQYQFTQRTMSILDVKTLYKNICDFDFLEAMYQYWLNQIVLWNSDFYIITFNGCKFDLQFMYKYIAKYHSGCIEIFGTVLSPKYIQISFNNHKIKFIDLYLILGEGSLNKWAEKCGLGQKLDYKPIYSIDQFLKLSLEEKQTIINYCEQDVKLTGSIYYQQCLNMVQMLIDLRINFNWENAIDVLKPTLASTAYSIFKNGFVNQSIKYINSIDWLTEQRVRQAYNGGFCHCFQLGEIKGDISYFDINSLYPFIMLQEFPLSPPSLSYVNINLQNLPRFIEKEQYTHWKVIDFQFKEGTKICLIPQRINSMNFYFQSGYDLQDCFVPSYVLKLIINDLLFIRIRGALRYNCDFSYIFKDYVSKMYDLRLLAKQRKDELSEKRIKTLMNALYGKTAQSSKLKQDLISSQNRNTFETSGACSFEFSQYLDAFILDIPVSKDDSLSYLALEIASRARFYLFEAIYKNKNGIIYCDTDSVILNQVPLGINVDEVKLGYWKDVYKNKNINGLYIYSPKVYEVRYQFMKDGEIVQESEIKMKGIDKSHQNFKENFKVLQNTFEGSFDEQVVWNKHNGFVRQNKISKKLKHRLRRFVNENGSTRPFMNIEEYEKYFRKSLIIKDDKFIYI